MPILDALMYILTIVPTFMLAHAVLIGGVGTVICLAGALAWVKIRASQQADQESHVAISTEGHEVWAGYDGEGVYAWSCTCGEAESDFTGLDAATLASTDHLLDVGAVPA
jgi:hypothetical protein